jgi:serine phosphatase RsbU (regulator of sigma subunit)
VIGSSLPDLQEKRVELVAGDVIVLTSDGIAQPERWSPRFLGAPRYAAEAWLAERARDDDDALALVARYGAV